MFLGVCFHLHINTCLLMLLGLSVNSSNLGFKSAVSNAIMSIAGTHVLYIWNDFKYSIQLIFQFT